MIQTRALSRLASRSLTKLNGSKQLAGGMRRSRFFPAVPASTSEPFPFLLPFYSSSIRGLSTSNPLQKDKKKNKGKGGGGGKGDYNDIPGMTPPDPSTDGLTNKPEIFNHAKLQSRIDDIVSRFREEAVRARTFAGKADPKIFEDLTIELKTSTAAQEKQFQTTGKVQKTEKHKLKELAHVAPKTGKEVIITVNEPRWVDNVAATVMDALNMNAQRTGSPNVLRVEIPPPTVESRKENAKEVQNKYMSAKAQLDILKRNSHKGFRDKTKDYKKDDLARAEKEATNLLSHAEEEMKKLCDATKKVIEG